MKVEKILLPTDFSDCARTALTQAIFLADRYEAELHLLHVVELHTDDPFNAAYHFPDCNELYDQLCKVAESEMSKLLGDKRVRTLRVHEHQVRSLAVAPTIVSFALEERVDLIVMGGHGRRGLRRFFLGSVAEEVVRTAPCPVLTLRHTERDPLARIETVVAPVDFSDDSARALGLAFEIAADYGARVDVVHAVEPVSPTVMAAASQPASDYELPNLAPRVETALGRMVEEVRGELRASEVSEVGVRLRVLEGQPGRSVAGYAAEQGAGLIVIASHGLGFLEHFLMGSVSEKVVRLAECPVLTLKGRPHLSEGEMGLEPDRAELDSSEAVA